ncbi:hypothetical protein ElyMa_004228500 [Elysia marginata]|uniref:Alpha-macroglobulin receptor-binding domain-containing protein n=1 Tax=Elysia marginata TaxID=1093978 RepID=A0AAV4GTI2_9GAST|nr:hypothetical protein ElyMa_004228500 [Elysia marginata]
MSILAVEIPPGYSPDQEKLKEAPKVSKVEVKEGFINIYFNSDVCISIVPSSVTSNSRNSKASCDIAVGVVLAAAAAVVVVVGGGGGGGVKVVVGGVVEVVVIVVGVVEE